MFFILLMFSYPFDSSFFCFTLLASGKPLSSSILYSN